MTGRCPGTNGEDSSVSPECPFEPWQPLALTPHRCRSQHPAGRLVTHADGAGRTLTVGFLACAKDLDDRVVGGAERRWPWLGKPRDAHARAPSLLPMLIVGAVVFWVFAARGAPVGAAALTWTVFAVWAAVLVIRGRRTQGAAPRQMHSERVGRLALARGRRRCPPLTSGRTGRRHSPSSVAAVSASPEPPHPNRRTRLRAAERDRRVRRPSGRTQPPRSLS